MSNEGRTRPFKKITIKQFLKIEMPDIIINSGAYTKVDLAETDRKRPNK